MTDYARKQMVFFDMDGTLALSKSAIDDTMSTLLKELLAKKKVAVISGGAWPQFEKQLVSKLNAPAELLSNLYICPGGGSSMYRFVNGTREEVYSHPLSAEDKAKISSALAVALQETGFDESAQTYGERLEDRDSSMAFSALGQQAPLEIKSAWDPDHAKRDEIMAHMQPLAPDYEIRIGGTSTIDITKKGIDKAFGIQQASERLGVPIQDMLYVGDALYPGGNDEPAIKSGVDCKPVKDIEETKQLIREIIQV